jgi:hypothetical protein
MSSRNGNYAAFYVSEPFDPSSLGAHATPDFQTYNLIRAWKGADSSYPFIDSHSKTYSVRDGSDWELTLKPRLRERLRESKNIILILSSITENSRALKEEINYGINYQGLPIIVVYPDYGTEESLHKDGVLKKEIKDLWDKLPIFRDSMSKVPTLHIPNKKEIIKKSLLNSNFMLGTESRGIFLYKT